MKDKNPLIIFLAVFILSSLIVPKLIFMRDGRLETSILNAYGDVGWHVANITTVAANPKFPLENPVFADTPLVYPFAANYISGILHKLGLSLTLSLTLPAILLIPFFFTLLYCFTRDLTNKKSVAVLTVILFLLSGATLGFTRIFFPVAYDFQDFSGFGSDPGGYQFLNPILALFLPQRSFLFGLPMAISILYLLLPNQKPSIRKYLSAGALSGILPLFHAHTVIALIPAIIAFFFLKPKPFKNWLIFVATSLIIGTPAIIYYLSGIHDNQSFFRFAPGWTDSGNFIWFWLKNTGFVLPLTLIALIYKVPKSIKTLAVSGLIIFAISNLFLFAPWAWDNFKLLIYWYLFSLPLVAWLLVHLWQKNKIYLKTLTIIILTLQITSATIDLTKLALPNANHWTEWDQAAINVAEAIKKSTQPGDSILTAPIHNSPASLAGRPIYLGHPAHVWSHGGDPWAREQGIDDFYNGKISQLPETQTNYILVGPSEHHQYPDLIIQPHWQLVTQSGPYKLFRQ